MRIELRNKIKKENEFYKMVQNLIEPLGFSLCARSVFYGQRPFEMYCGEIDNYQSLIEDIDSIKQRYLKAKSESLGIS